MSTELPTNRIKKIKLPDNTEYTIVPEQLQSDGYQATLPELSEDSVIALTNDLTKVSCYSMTILTATGSSIKINSAIRKYSNASISDARDLAIYYKNNAPCDFIGPAVQYGISVAECLRIARQLQVEALATFNDNPPVATLTYNTLKQLKIDENNNLLSILVTDTSNNEYVFNQKFRPVRVGSLGEVLSSHDYSPLQLTDNGNVKFSFQSATSSIKADVDTFSSNATFLNDIKLSNGTYSVNLRKPSTITSDKIVYFQDKGGTVALMSDITTVQIDDITQLESGD